MVDKETRGTCITCKYVAEGYDGLECRVVAPTVDYKSSYRKFPRVFEHDWCARFKEADNG